MEGLREDDAIKRPFRQGPRDRDIANDCGERVGHVDMENVAFLDLIAAEPERIRIVADFENSAANPGGVASQKTLDVIAIDRRSPVEAEIGADRLGSSEISEIDGAWQRRPEATRQTLTDRRGGFRDETQQL